MKEEKRRRKDQCSLVKEDEMVKNETLEKLEDRQKKKGG